VTPRAKRLLDSLISPAPAVRTLRFSARGGARAATLLLAALLVSQASAALLSVSAASVAPPPPAPRPSASFSPHYEILGELDGGRLLQSQRPQSVPLNEGIQFAATYYTAKDLQAAYNMTGLISQGYGGEGKTIAIIDAYGDPTIRQDLAAFDKQFGLPPADLTIVPVGPYEPANGITFGWDAETALDVEAAHTAAPYAHINLVVASNASNALFAAVKTVVDRRLGDVVSMSWGLGENSYGESGFSVAGFLNYAYLDYYFQKGAAEGITFLASSGDYGAFDGTPAVTADFPATSPFVTGVGGTTLYLAGATGYGAANSTATYESESAWSISPQYVGSQGVSSGGGYSDIFAQPYYQAGAISSAVRTAPDVSADANPYTGFVIVLEGGEYAIGGTSLASPLWAGMTADMDQYAGRDLGLLNPSLYSIYADRAEYLRAFHQVTFGFDGEYQAGSGYNLVTGLGSPNLPALAADVKGEGQGVAVTVDTSPSNATSAPAQYVYGEAFTISATATGPTGPVTTGTVDANIFSPGGQVAVVPLSYDGFSWTGTYTPAPTDPPGSWTIQVYVTSGTAYGYGIADVSIGDSLGIVAPVPYPFGPTLEAGQAFSIEAVADSPGGTPLSSLNLTAHLIHGGTTVSDVTLTPQGDGFYQGEGNITASDPQGTYTLVVDSPGAGRVFSYFYVGEAVTGVILTPLDSASPSAAPGQRLVFLAQTKTASGEGVFTSNTTADVYSLSGALMASAKLQPAPNAVQFGVFDFFRFAQANFTVPANLTQGFYRVEFQSSYAGNRTTLTQLGNYTTGFYVSSPTLSYTISAPASVYEGEDVRVMAKVTNSTGAPVDAGVFLATVVPSGYAFESYLTDFYGYTGVPMEYNATLGEWVGDYQIPSPITPFNGFVGNVPALSAGPWTVFVTGESAGAVNLVPGASYVNVLPYVYYPNGTLTASDVAAAPLVVASGGGYVLSGIGRGALSVSGINITLVEVDIGDLTVDNATVALVGSHVGTITSTGSKLALLAGTSVGELSMKSTRLTVSASSYGVEGAGAPYLDYLLYAVAAVALAALVVSVLAYRRKGWLAPSPSPQV
jgi:subtilase family serine protease